MTDRPRTIIDLIARPPILAGPVPVTAPPVMTGGEPFYFPAAGRTLALLIHGWTGSPYEVRPIGEALAAAGIPALGIRLPGHGTTPEEMARFTWQDWLKAARTDLRQAMAGDPPLERKPDRVVVIGQSMGGLIALAFAAEQQPGVAGIACLSTPVWLVGPHSGALDHFRRFWPPGQPIDNLMDPTHRETIVNYRQVHVLSVLTLLDFASAVRRKLRRVTLPIFIGVPGQDRVVPARSFQVLRDGIRSSDVTVRRYPRSGHMIALDYDGPQLAADMVAFIRHIEGASRGD